MIKTIANPPKTNDTIKRKKMKIQKSFKVFIFQNFEN